jgi:hypothetical protein
MVLSKLVEPFSDGWAYRFTKPNTTILYYWSASLSDLVPLNISDPSTDVAMHLDRPPAFMRRLLLHFDVLVLNTGYHWNRGKLNANRWVMHVDGKPNEDKKNVPKSDMPRILQCIASSYGLIHSFLHILALKLFFGRSPLGILLTGTGTPGVAATTPLHWQEEVKLCKMDQVIVLLRVP